MDNGNIKFRDQIHREPNLLLSLIKLFKNPAATPFSKHGNILILDTLRLPFLY